VPRSCDIRPHRHSKIINNTLNFILVTFLSFLKVKVLNLISCFVDHFNIYRVSQEECARLREGVPYVKVYRYNPKHLFQKLNGYGDNGQKKAWSSCGSTHCTCQVTILTISVLEFGIICRQFRPP